MADTIRGDWPDQECDDCGNKGTMFHHWGPLVPSGISAKLCGECMIERSKASRVQPLGYKKQMLKIARFENMKKKSI